MKTSLLFAFFLCVVTLSAQETPKSQTATGGVGIDNLKFGESRVRMIEEFGMPDDSVMFMGCTCYYSYFQEGIAVGIFNTGQIIQVVLNNDEATYPIDKKFTPFKGQLKEGITIKSSWADIEKAYGKPDMIIEPENQPIPTIQVIYNEKALSFLMAKDYSKLYYIVVAAKELK